MTSLHTRAWTGDLQIRGDGRTVYGTVVPYNTPTMVDDGAGPYQEMFAPGAFTRSLEQRGDKIKLLVNHNRGQLPIGRAVNFAETDSGLYGEFHVSATRNGDEALTLLRDGAVDAFSVGFRGVEDHRDNGVTVRTEAALSEVSIVAFPAYADALVAGVRNVDPDLLARLIADVIRDTTILAGSPDNTSTETEALVDSPDDIDTGTAHRHAQLRARLAANLFRS